MCYVFIQTERVVFFCDTLKSNLALIQICEEPVPIVENTPVDATSSDYELFVGHVFGDDTPTIAGLGDDWSDVFSFVSVKQQLKTCLNIDYYFITHDVISAQFICVMICNIFFPRLEC